MDTLTDLTPGPFAIVVADTPIGPFESIPDAIAWGEATAAQEDGMGMDGCDWCVVPLRGEGTFAVWVITSDPNDEHVRLYADLAAAQRDGVDTFAQSPLMSPDEARVAWDREKYDLAWLDEAYLSREGSPESGPRAWTPDEAAMVAAIENEIDKRGAHRAAASRERAKWCVMCNRLAVPGTNLCIYHTSAADKEA